MKSKLHTWAEETWSCLVITAASILFLIMIFAWAVIIILTVAKSVWFLALIPLWPLDIYLLKKVLDYAGIKWGENSGDV